MITTSSLSGVAGDVMRLGCRIALGVTLLLHPVCDSLGWANGLHAQAGGFQEVQMVFLQLSDMRNIVVGSLFFLIAIWVVFGIRTRVMASLATALVLTFHFAVAHEPWRLDHQMVLTLITIAIAVPLICCGGGRFSLWRGGWGNLL
ncbi:hypothetical protein [Celeribacter persicus]|uniref:Uncharacterized protein n=1 Tax=Celeribacter persicus TaxID=1651082 RepID=A0A2T5H8V6_9RHOB|nr:hypothetical protein [Celeribacter persicus]PTQ67993.1 hypothetical protein C8N42_1168 [Celeribacter persicus]